MLEVQRLLFLATAVAGQTVVQVNYGFFKEPAGHLWTYGVDAHSWTDVENNVTYRFTFWPQTSGGKVIKKLQTGELDVAHLGNAPWGTGATRGIPAKMAYLIHSKDLSQCLVSRQGLKGPKELKGMRVAYIKGSTTHYMLQAFFVHTSVTVEDLEWVGHMSALEQRAAWDRGEIDAGFMWGGNMRYLQENVWCSQPDPSSPNYRPCAAAGINKTGHNLFTAGMSRTWGVETWNNLAMRDAFIEEHPRAAARIVKVIAVMDTKYVQDPGSLRQNPDRLCQVAIAAGQACDAAGLETVDKALGYDTWVEYAVQRSPAYLAERLPGACARETIPATTGDCMPETMSGSAWSTWATSEFGFRLKTFPYLPPYKFYQDMMAPQFVGLVHTAQDEFPEITAEALMTQYTAHLELESDPAHSFCGDLAQPIILTQPGVFTDHEGGGFHQDGTHCEWHIKESQPVLLSDIDVRIEVDLDNVYIYEGLCSLHDGTCDTAEAPLLARLTGGKGMSQYTMEDLNPRPPIFVPGGSVTVVFVNDIIADRPVGEVVSDGVSMRWSLAPEGGCALTCRNGGTCVGGRCHCVGGWSGADCSSPSCLGTASLDVSADAPGTLLNGVPGMPSAHNADCRWVLTAQEPGHIIALEINRLDLDWTYDPLLLYDGVGVDAELLAEYSGYKPAKLGVTVGARCPGPACPGAAISSAGVLTVRWTSDGMQSGEGFELVYRSVEASSAKCGVGPVAACSSHGACLANGCACEEGWYGRFCQFRQCDGPAEALRARGRISNMASDELAYEPIRDCTWVVRPPPDEAGRTAGAIAFWVERFDLEAAESSGATVTAGDWLMVGGRSFNASYAPCVATSDSCWAAPAGSEAPADCNCAAVVIQGTEAEVRFATDLNDYPHGSSHKGFVLRHEAVYDCPREGSGLCVALDKCDEMDMVAGRTACVNCQKGSVLRRGDDVGAYCHQCIPGRFQGFDSQNKPECQTCPAGRYTSVEGQVDCKQCEPGNFCSRGADHMMPCSPGTFTNENASDSCKRCEVGTYQNNSGSTDCISCKSQTTTQVMAATQEEECVCPRGYALGAPGGNPCGECPPIGVDCPGGGAPFAAEMVLDDTPRLMRGYMVMQGKPWEVYFCDSAKTASWGGDYCPDGRSLYNASAMCGPGVALVPQCARCLEGYFISDNMCQQCPNDSGWLLLGKALGYGAVLLVFLGYLYSKSNNDNSRGLLAVMSLINLVQTLHVLGRMDLTWQPPLTAILATLTQVFSISGLFTATLEVEVNCALHAGFVVTFLAHVMIPTAVPLAYAVIGLIAKCVRRPIDVDKVINVVGDVFTGLMVSVSALAFSLFAATSMPNGRSMLKDYPEVELLSPEWWSAMPIGLLAVLVYCVLFLAIIIYVVIHAPVAVSDHPYFTVRYGFIFGDTKPDCWWWVVVSSLFAMCLNAVQVLVSSVQNQLFLSALVVALFSALQTYVRPLKFRANNVVEDCLNLAYVLILVLASAFVDESRVTPEQRRDMWHTSSVLILTITCFAAMASLAVFGRHLWWQCRPPGTKLARVLHTAMEFRHTSLLAAALPNEEYAKKAAALADHDLHRLEEARRVLVSCFFLEQPGRHLWQQRLIPDAEFKCFEQGESFSRLRKCTQDGTLDAALQDNLMHLLELEQLQQELVARANCSPSRIQAAIVKARTEGELQQLSEMPSESPTFSIRRPRRWPLFTVHEQRRPMSREVMTSVVTSIVPDLTEEQANKLFDLMDMDASGGVTPEEASATLQGLASTVASESQNQKSLHVLIKAARRMEKSKSLATTKSDTPEQTQYDQDKDPDEDSYMKV